MNWLVEVAMFAAFLGGYQYLRVRAGRRLGQRPAVQWWWLAAIIVAAGIAVVVGEVTR